MIVALILAAASPQAAPPAAVRVAAVARARIVSARRLDLRNPPRWIEGARKGRRTIDFE